MAREMVRQVMVRIDVTPSRVEMNGWWYMRYLTPDRSHGQIFKREFAICSFDVCISNCRLVVEVRVLSDSVWFSRRGMERVVVELVRRAMCKGSNNIDSSVVTTKDL